MKLNNNDDSHNSGLNLLIYNMLLDIESHPAWVCGLKPWWYGTSLGREKSHPAWVCGLKLKSAKSLRKVDYVTPCVGVWIETPNTLGLWMIVPVTPCVGVWIETSHTARRSFATNCHTLRGCVDWNKGKNMASQPGGVTPCVGVWIETTLAGAG